MCGVLCVMMAGAVLMPQWCVASLDTPLKVRNFLIFLCSCCLVHNSDRIGCKQVSVNFHLVPGVLCLVVIKHETS